MKKVSILTPIYNVEKYIERCVESLFTQTYKNIEYIFVDDCSPDNSVNILEAILEKYPDRKKMTKIIRHPHNKGLSAARNSALEAASGDYVMPVDSDDYLEVNTVMSAVDLAERENAEIVTFDMNYIYDDKTVKKNARVISDKWEYLHSVIRRDSQVCVCGSLYKKSLYVNNNIRAIEGLNYGEDYVTKPKLIYYANKVCYLPAALYNYVQYNNSAYTKNINRDSINNILFAIEILDKFFCSKYNSKISCSEISNELKIRNKVFLLEYCAPSERRFINSLFPEMNGMSVKMSFKHKIVWHLSQMNCIVLLNIYLNIGTILKKILHI